MKKLSSYFIYQGPHYVHAEWAKAIGSKFIHFRINKWMMRVKGSRFIARSLFLWLKPSNLVIAEGGSPLIEAALLKITKGGLMVYLATDITPYKMIKGDLFLKDATELSDLTIANSKMMLNDLLQVCRLKKIFCCLPIC